MRSYPRNSPQAAARLVALTLIADGNVCRSELDAMRHAGTEAQLGLAPGEFSAVLQTLCEDLLQSAEMHGSLSCCVDEPLLDALVREVDDLALQQRVVGAIVAAASADGHLADGERKVLDALRRGWQLQTVQREEAFSG